ncbi:MAG: inverse autotransporter beta domain-containing protein, partial [Candidatus Phlomobacter fragariae]
MSYNLPLHKHNYYSKGRQLTAYILLFIQLFLPLSLSFSSVVKAEQSEAINNDMINTMNGINALTNDNFPLSGNSNTLSSSVESNTTLLPLSSYQVSSEHDNTVRQADLLSAVPTLSIPEIKNETPELLGKQIAQGASQIGQILSNDNSVDAFINYAKSIGEGLVNQRVNDWLGQYGNSRISLSSNKTISGDFLLPLIDNPNSLLFTQLGLRRNSDRNIANIGFGYRQYWEDWMYGINTFYDYDYSGGNARLGLGGEAWTDYLKLAANGYFGLTDWHQSKIEIMDDYNERPASGFDIHAETYLPTYPKLGGSIKYEKYFGKGVHLGAGVDPDKLKDDPYALTLGVNYTPIPLIILKGEHSAGDRNDTMVGLDVIYRFGVPLSQQLDPDAVDVMRSLVGNKYDFVDRNYDIVMQYRKQDLLNISLPEEVTAQAKEVVSVPVIVNKTKYGLKKINWSISPNFITNGGQYRETSQTNLEVTLPAYVFNTKNKSPQEYYINAVGIDNNGNESNKATTIIRVVPSKNIISDLVVTPEKIITANNNDYYTVTAKVGDEHGSPLNNQKIVFEIDGFEQDGHSGAELFVSNKKDLKNLTVTTDSQGKAVIYVRSKVSGEGNIKARMENGNYKKNTIKFNADEKTAL